MFVSSTDSATIDPFHMDLTHFTQQFPIAQKLLESEQFGRSKELTPLFAVPDYTLISSAELWEDGVLPGDSMGTITGLVTGIESTPGKNHGIFTAEIVRPIETLLSSSDVPCNEEISLIPTERGLISIEPSFLQRGEENFISTGTEDSKWTSPLHDCTPAVNVSTINYEGMNRSVTQLEYMVQKFRKQGKVSQKPSSIQKPSVSSNRTGEHKKNKKMMSMMVLRREVNRLLKVTAELESISACALHENKTIKDRYQQRKEELDMLPSNS